MAAARADDEATSGDFTVLDSTTSPPHGFLSPEGGAGGGGGEVSLEELKVRCEEAILKLTSICGSEDNSQNLRPFRIVVVGKHGAGKSSFINGVGAALSEDRWHEHAYTGSMGSGAPITITNQRLVKCCNEDNERYRNVLLPTFIDVAGLNDEADDKLEELLRLLFYGHIKEDAPLMSVYEDCQKHSKEDVREMYGETYPEMRVDRVLFVASSEGALPERLMACVHRAARPSHYRTERRAVPIYGVMTKKDKVDLESSEFLEKKKTFMQGLGLNQSRFLVCSNYCDDLDPDGQRTNSLRPDLDLPILQFMQLVCDRALKVVKDDEVLPGADNRTKEDRQNAANTQKQQEGLEGLQHMWRQTDPMVQDIVMATVVGLLTLMAAFLFLPSGANEGLSKACAAGAIQNSHRDILCGQVKSPTERFLQNAGVFFFATVVTVVVFLYRHVNRRL